MGPDEDWLPVHGWEGFYSVSNYGRLWSEPRLCLGRNQPSIGALKSPYLSSRGTHYHTDLWRDGERVRVQVHVLVAEAFISPRPQGLEVCHNDGNGLNNHVSNLRWDTHSANGHDNVMHGGNPATARETCRSGHLLEFPNLEPSVWTRLGHRTCFACNRASNRVSEWKRHGRPVVATKADLADDLYGYVMYGRPSIYWSHLKVPVWDAQNQPPRPSRKTV